MKSESMKAFPKPLTCEEESLYLNGLMTGDSLAREELIIRNLRLVAHVLKKYSLNELEQEEYISIGVIGLIKAIDSFDASKGIRLATYATRCIDNEILMTLRSNKKLMREVSLSDSIGQDKEGNEIQLIDVLISNDEEPGEELIHYELIELLHDALNSVLTSREYEIIRLRYGLGCTACTQMEISRMFHISRSYVSRIEKKAIDKMKKFFDKKLL
jgi:RNA polymerase sporulation-specific sigma factor